MVLSFISDWTIQQHLVRLEFLMKSMSGEEVAQELISVLSITLSVESPRMLTVMRDRASVNAAAMRVVTIMYPNLLDVRCFSHMLNLVGERFKVSTLSFFFTLWIALFSHSPIAKALWKETTCRAMATYSKTRWWSGWEVMNQVFQQFGDVEPFLQNNEDVGPSTWGKLMEILSNSQQLITLKMELSSVIDVEVHFVKATYRLKGDGILVLNCYEEILKLRSAIQTGYYPNVQAIAIYMQSYPGNVALQQQSITYAIGCVQPGLYYFQAKLGNDVQNPVTAFKAAALFSPSKVSDIKPTAANIDDLQAFPLLVSDTPHRKAELPAYLFFAAGVSPNVDILKW